MSDSILTRQVDGEEKIFESTLRPQQLSDFIGQQKVKDKILISVQAAVRRGGPAASQVVDKRLPDHVAKRQEQGRADLGPWHADLARPPGDVVEIESTDLACAQTVGGDEQEHRIVASSL